MWSQAMPPRSRSLALVPSEVIERRILLLRGRKVMLDRHLAELYAVPTKRLNEAVKRNAARFPKDFMFQLTAEEAAALRSQFATSSEEPDRVGSPTMLSSGGHGGRRYLPYVFTEQGVAMLSSVLKSDRAIVVNIAIMRTFVRLRQMLAAHRELARRLTAMEQNYDQRFKVVFDILRQLTEPPPAPPKRPIGFRAQKRGPG
jgi:hypothetical protein